MFDLPEKGTQEYQNLMDEIDEYAHGVRRLKRLQNVEILEEDVFCEYCHSRYHDSEAHPGICKNCGAPKPRIDSLVLVMAKKSHTRFGKWLCQECREWNHTADAHCAHCMAIYPLLTINSKGKIKGQ